MKAVYFAVLILGAARLVQAQAPATVSASVSTNAGPVAVNATNAVLALPEVTTPHRRLALSIKNPSTAIATNWFRFGAAATVTNGMPLAPGESYSESYPVVDNRALYLLGSTNDTIWVEEKLE